MNRAVLTAAAVLLTGNQGPENLLPSYASRNAMPETHYVSPAGSDAGSGTMADPWATPGFASRQMAAGDTLVILEGRYSLSVFDDDIVRPPSGIPGMRTVIRGEPGKRPILAGSSNLLALVDITDQSHVHLKGLELTSDNGAPSRDAILGDESQTDIHLEDLYIHHMDEAAVNMHNVHGLVISDSRFTYCGLGGIIGSKDGNWREVMIRDTELSWSGFYYQGVFGPNHFDRPDGFGIEPSDGPIEFERVRVLYNRGDGLDSKSDSTHIWDSVIAHNEADGLKLWGGGSTVTNTLIYGRGGTYTEPTSYSAIVIEADGADETFEFRHITVDDIVGNNYIMHIEYDPPHDGIQVLIANSIFNARNERSALFAADEVDLSIESSVFFFPESEEVFSSHTYGIVADDFSSAFPTSIYADPLFVAPAAPGEEGNYRLQPGSPAMNLGAPEYSVGTDLDGVIRPVGLASDAGAYQGSLYMGGEPSLPDAPSLEVYPNPTRGLLNVRLDRAPLAASLLLVDPIGRRVTGLSVQLGRSPVQWRLPEQLAGGTYFLLVRSADGAERAVPIQLIR
ncbi:MAG: right-handed parallel beta-helix repeat-containing protein [Rhodothermales bacterium]|nr:right-handed parallel beta-helix repeat-containing protein [Rhodothermales bacterium]MBO6778061.1 right-handed parallel beta-helix repeat-containing protein [Rhodothermales bacterium]